MIVPRHKRRWLVWKLALAGGVSAILLSACGGGGGGSTTSAGGGGGAVNPSGIITVTGVLNSTGGAQFFPTTSQQSLDDPWFSAIYGSLLQAGPDGSITPSLAQGYQIVNPTTVDVELRPGMKFSDGEAFNAEAVQTSLLTALRKPANAAVQASRTPGFQAISNVVVDSPTKVTIKLSSPVASQLLLSLADPREGAISAPSADQSAYPNVKPIGAGPFMLKSFVPDQSITVVKNPNYFDAKQI
jgi:peptide/nickel transport system substrate-binding protein